MTTSPTSDASAELGHGLSFEQAVPCSLAHRRSAAEVYVTDTSPAGADVFVVAIQIPRAHSVWFDRALTYHDPLSTVEAIRQAVLVVGHRYLGVAHHTPGSLQRVAFSVEDLSAYRDTEKGPLEGIVRIRFLQSAGSTGYYKDTSFEASLTIESVQALTLRGGGIAFPREAYDELRGLQQRQRPANPLTADHRPVPLDPSAVGRRDPRNVVVGRLGDPGTSDQLGLIIDQRHPYFFEHPYDHVPAALFLEAIRQTAIVAATRSGDLPSPVAAVTGANADFTGFAELDGAIALSANVEGEMEFGGIDVAVQVSQFGQQIASAGIELSPYP